MEDQAGKVFQGKAQLQKLIREISRKSVQAQGYTDHLEISDFETDLQVYSHWMAIVLIFGSPLRITFKVHFKTKQARCLAAPAYRVPPESVTSIQALDFMREFCNLTAGSLKRALLQQNLNLGMSLPLISRGFDQIFFRPAGVDSFTDLWQLESPAGPVVCSATFEFSESLDLTSVQMADETDGEIEFV